jgi:hypothetical protein
MQSDRNHRTTQRPRQAGVKQPGRSCAAGQPAPRTAAQPDGLHICLHCGGRLVYPLAWSEVGHRRWRLQLRCPECESICNGVFERSIVERLDDELDRAASALLDDLRRVTHANMSEEIEFFSRALAADLIDAGDF